MGIATLFCDVMKLQPIACVKEAERSRHFSTYSTEITTEFRCNAKRSVTAAYETTRKTADTEHSCKCVYFVWNGSHWMIDITEEHWTRTWTARCKPPTVQVNDPRTRFLGLRFRLKYPHLNPVKHVRFYLQRNFYPEITPKRNTRKHKPWMTHQLRFLSVFGWIDKSGIKNQSDENPRASPRFL